MVGFLLSAGDVLLRIIEPLAGGVLELFVLVELVGLWKRFLSGGCRMVESV